MGDLVGQVNSHSSTRLIILHTNDIHGRVEGLARVASLVEQIREENQDAHVLYFDLGDSEDYSNRLSNLTKGVVMHRLLSVAGCDAVAVGNAAMPRYGPQVLRDHVAASRYPHLLANLRMPDGDLLPGVQPTALLDLDGFKLGLIGVSDAMDGYEQFFGIRALPVAPLVHELAQSLREQGAHAVIVLSHLGLKADRELAAEVQGAVAIILGAHSHDLLPEGERVADVLIAQAGNYAEHVGRIDLEWDGAELTVLGASTLPVPESTLPSARVVSEVETIESEVERFMAEIVGELVQPLDYTPDRECDVANLMADALRDRFQADVGLLIVGHAFNGPLPAGRLSRVALWDACPSTANPGVATMTGAQLIAMVKRGLDPDRAAEMPHSLRGRARGPMHLSGASLRDGRLFVSEQPVDSGREYSVAASDYEFEPRFEYADAEWNLNPSYDVPIILREALEEYLAAHSPIRVESGRVQGRFASTRT